MSRSLRGWQGVGRTGAVCCCLVVLCICSLRIATHFHKLAAAYNCRQSMAALLSKAGFPKAIAIHSNIDLFHPADANYFVFQKARSAGKACDQGQNTEGTKQHTSTPSHLLLCRLCGRLGLGRRCSLSLCRPPLCMQQRACHALPTGNKQ